MTPITTLTKPRFKAAFNELYDPTSGRHEVRWPDASRILACRHCGEPTDKTARATADSPGRAYRNGCGTWKLWT